MSRVAARPVRVGRGGVREATRAAADQAGLPSQRTARAIRGRGEKSSSAEIESSQREAREHGKSAALVGLPSHVLTPLPSEIVRQSGWRSWSAQRIRPAEGGRRCFGVGFILPRASRALSVRRGRAQEDGRVPRLDGCEERDCYPFGRPGPPPERDVSPPRGPPVAASSLERRGPFLPARRLGRRSTSSRAVRWPSPPQCAIGLLLLSLSNLLVTSRW